MGYLQNLDDDGEGIDSIIFSNNTLTGNNRIETFYIRTNNDNHSLIERNIFKSSGGGSLLRLQTGDASIIRNNIIDNTNTAINFYDISTTIENNIFIDNSNIFYANGLATSAPIRNNIFFNNNNFIENQMFENLPIGIGDVMTINVNGDSIDTYGNIYDDPMLIPSDSTLVFSWDLDENGIFTFKTNPYNEYFSVIGNPLSGYMNIYGNGLDILYTFIPNSYLLKVPQNFSVYIQMITLIKAT